jgi:Amt family ammonium transporter
MGIHRTHKRKVAIVVALLLLLGVFNVGGVLAQGEGESDPYALAINTVWVLIAGALVFFMQAGFGFLEAGFVRAKNVGNILMENFIDTAITGISYWAIGFGIMFGAGSAFMGTQFFLLLDIPDTYAGIPTLAFFFFQFAFSAAASTIASGALAERTRFKADLLYSAIVSGLIYPIVGHWIWQSEGLLAQMGFWDFAGSTVVHSLGAYVGLMGTLFLGARRGKSFGKNAQGIPGHSMTVAALGTFILWLGWFGFNPGSTLSGMAAADIALIMVNTNLAACAGAFAVLALGWWQSGVPQLPWAFNGTLAGLVAITAPCAWVTPLESVVIGAIGGAVMYAGVYILERFRIDDPVGAVPVHGFGGVWGTLAVGIFANSTTGGPVGLLHGGGLEQLGIQAVGVVVVAAFVLTSAGVMFAIIRATIGLRVPEQAEMLGLDIYEHGLVTYPEFTNAFSVPAEPKPGSPHARPRVPSAQPTAADFLKAGSDQ